jgi:hypothetical protein
MFHDCSRRRQIAMLSASVVSLVSWLTPLALGACKELNFSVHWSQILLAYGGLLLGIIVIQLINRYWLNRPPAPAEARLLDIADRGPVHKTLEGPLKVSPLLND